MSVTEQFHIDGRNISCFVILLVLLGACSYGILAIFVKLAYAEGFSLGEVIGSQYLFGWIILLAITLLFSRHRVPLKQALILFVAGTSASFTGIFIMLH